LLQDMEQGHGKREFHRQGPFRGDPGRPAVDLPGPWAYATD
jgi:hypothetical protein